MRIASPKKMKTYAYSSNLDVINHYKMNENHFSTLKITPLSLLFCLVSQIQRRYIRGS